MVRADSTPSSGCFRGGQTKVGGVGRTQPQILSVEDESGLGEKDAVAAQEDSIVTGRLKTGHLWALQNRPL